MVSTGLPQPNPSEKVLTCCGSGSIPELFENVTGGTRFSACSICGKVVLTGGVVGDH
jgi:hypothetical protein